MKIIMLFFVFIFMACSSTKPNSTKLKPLKRVALVIGNKNYTLLKKLENPVNDAYGIQKVLKDMDFDVTLATNLKANEFSQFLAEFQAKIDENTIVFFYFAGHANTLQRNSSQEYLAMIEDEEALSLVSLYSLYEVLIEAKGRYNIVVIDACRNYEESVQNSRIVSRGGNLREVLFDKGITLKANIVLDNNYSSDFPPSTVISYATMHNQKAYDKSPTEPNHSPYTKALIEHLDDEEVPIEVVFKRVRKALIKELHGKQINLEESSLEKNIWLQAKKGSVALSEAF